MRKVFATLLLVLGIVHGQVSANNPDCEQSVIEVNVQESLRELEIKRDRIKKEKNDLRAVRLSKEALSEYQQLMSSILCVENSLTFNGKVWSVDIDEIIDSEIHYKVSIASESDKNYFPFFYTYKFNGSDSMVESLERLTPGDDVEFKFHFASDPYDGSDPLGKNPDTGNPAFIMNIDLIDIKSK